MLLCRSTKHSKPDVCIVRCKHTGYWLVNITCKDRNKLLFDTVSPLPAPMMSSSGQTSCSALMRLLLHFLSNLSEDETRIDKY